MYDAGKALIVLVEPSEVRQVFPAWPREMQVAVCMHDSGSCELAVFRQEESGAVALRLIRQMGLPRDMVSVFPAVEGFETHALRFADQRRLLKLVGETPELVGEAEDYSANYEFALEEGLDPAQLMGLDFAEEEDPHVDAAHDDKDCIAEDQPQDRVTEPQPDLATEPALFTRSGLPSFLRPVAADGPGPGFKSVRQIVRDEDEGALYRVRNDRKGWIVLSRKQKGAFAEELIVMDQDKLHLREEDGVIAVAVNPAQSPVRGVPPRIRIRAEGLPQRMVDALGGGSRKMRLKHDDGFLFLYPSKENSHRLVADTAKAIPLRGLRRSQGRRMAFGLRSAFVLSGLVAVLGWVGIETSLTKHEFAAEKSVGQGVDWDRYRLTRNGERAG